MIGLRALVLDLNIAIHGVPITVTRPAPDNAPIATRGIWITTTTEDHAGEFNRRGLMHAIALSKSAVPTVPRGTLIVGAERESETEKTWRVDAFMGGEADQHRVIVTEVVT